MNQAIITYWPYFAILGLASLVTFWPQIKAVLASIRNTIVTPVADSSAAGVAASTAFIDVTTKSYPTYVVSLDDPRLSVFESLLAIRDHLQTSSKLAEGDVEAMLSPIVPHLLRPEPKPTVSPA